MERLMTARRSMQECAGDKKRRDGQKRSSVGEFVMVSVDKTDDKRGIADGLIHDDSNCAHSLGMRNARKFVKMKALHRIGGAESATDQTAATC